jgi:hypothetical protein
LTDLANVRFRAESAVSPMTFSDLQRWLEGGVELGRAEVSSAPDKDVQPLFGATPKQTFRRRATSTGVGGKRPYRSRLGKDRNARESCHCMASAK